MARPVTLFTIQWGRPLFGGDLRPGAEDGLRGPGALCRPPGHAPRRLRSRLRPAGQGHPGQIQSGLLVHQQPPGRPVRVRHPAGAYDSRLDGFAPAQYAGDPAAIQAWAMQEMKDTAHAAKAMGVDTVTFFMGSPIWKLWYSFPQTSEAQVEAGYQQVKELWSPIMDEFDDCGVKLALEIHPTEIAFDYWSTKKLLGRVRPPPTLGINFDPSHLVWQGLDPQMFLLDFADRIYHVHVKDVKLNLNGRNGILGSHITFGDPAPGLELRLPRPRRRGPRQHHPGPQPDPATPARCPSSGRTAAWSGSSAAPRPAPLPRRSISRPRTWPLTTPSKTSDPSGSQTRRTIP